MNIRNILFFLPLIGLAFSPVQSQSFFGGRYTSIKLSYGYGKIIYYFDYTPTYIVAADQAAAEYSPSWGLGIDKNFWLNKQFDFSVGLSHITITEKTHQTAKPPWFGFSEKNLTQSFIHLVPTLKIKLPDERFNINIGVRFGTANFIGNTRARTSSNSLGSFNADIALKTGGSIAITNKLFFDAEWIHGLTKYAFSVGMPVEIVTFYKYHSFHMGIIYIINETNK